MKFTNGQLKLLEFVKEQHGDQVRKYTGEPYWNHLVAVAEIVNEYDNDNFEIEIALCHDLFEDTDCKILQLVNALVEFGYSVGDSNFIITRVSDLTDVYTSKKYPSLNRKARKKLESKRLHHIDPIAQTVKYADLIDNSNSIVERDKGFAKLYLHEKYEILSGMVQGNIDLYAECMSVWVDSNKMLENAST